MLNGQDYLGSLSYSYTSSKETYRSFRPLSPTTSIYRDLSDSEDIEDKETIRAFSPKFKRFYPPVRDSILEASLPDTTLKTLRTPKPYSRTKSLSTDQSETDKGTVRAPSSPSPSQPIADLQQVTHDAKLAASTILSSLIVFIAFHVVPLIDLFPLLLRARMGATTSSLVVVGLSGSMGYHLSIFRDGYLMQLEELRKRRTYASGKRLLVLLIFLYSSTYTTAWTFQILFHIHQSVPLVGAAMVATFISITVSICFAMTLYRSFKLSYTMTATAYPIIFGDSKSPSGFGKTIVIHRPSS